MRRLKENALIRNHRRFQCRDCEKHEDDVDRLFSRYCHSDSERSADSGTRPQAGATVVLQRQRVADALQRSQKPKNALTKQY